MGFADLVENADRAAQDHLGSVDVLYDDPLQAAVTVKGIFDERYELIQPGNAGVEMVAPAVWLRLEDLPSDPRDEKLDPKITISGKEYRIRERQTDGIGGTIRLLLHRVGLE